MWFDSRRWRMWWSSGGMEWTLSVFIVCLLALLLFMGAMGQRAAHDVPAPAISTQQACARLLVEVDMLHGEGAREDAAAVRRVCAELRAADADAVGMAITTGGT